MLLWPLKTKTKTPIFMLMSNFNKWNLQDSYIRKLLSVWLCVLGKPKQWYYYLFCFAIFVNMTAGLHIWRFLIGQVSWSPDPDRSLIGPLHCKQGSGVRKGQSSKINNKNYIYSGFRYYFTLPCVSITKSVLIYENRLQTYIGIETSLDKWNIFNKR